MSKELYISDLPPCAPKTPPLSLAVKKQLMIKLVEEEYQEEEEVEEKM